MFTTQETVLLLATAAAATNAFAMFDTSADVSNSKPEFEA